MKWKRIQRHCFKLEGLHYTALVNRDRQKVWHYAINGDSVNSKSAPNKAYALHWAEKKLEELEIGYCELCLGQCRDES